MNIADIEKQVLDIIGEKLNRREEVRMDWTVHEALERFGEIHGEAAEFYTVCAHDTLYRVLKKVVSKFDAEDESPNPQLSFSYLQECYSVERDGERRLIPRELLTDHELLERAAQFRKQSRAMVRHAAEIEQYVADRTAKAA